MVEDSLMAFNQSPSLSNDPQKQPFLEQLPEEVTYTWNIDTDAMTWGLEAVNVFGVKEMSSLNAGTSFATLIDQASPTSRHAEIFESNACDHGAGVAFSARYIINPLPGIRFWVEDTGRWFASESGRPRLVHGVCRRVIAPTDKELSLISKRQLDPTTGALTRSDFCNGLADAIRTAAQDKRETVLFLIAIENLTDLNNTYGYQIGDEIIAALVRRLRGMIRRRDIIGRYGSNKFGLILSPGVAEHMEMVATRLINGVRSNPVETSAGAISLSIKIGGVAIPRDAATTSDALHACEEALASVKKRFDYAFEAYTANSNKTLQRSTNREMTEIVLSALNDRRIRLAYQPIILAKTGEIVMHECLARMLTPEGEWKGAGYFVPEAERLGFLHLIDHRVLELAVQTLREDRDIVLTVNVGVDTALHPEWMAAFKAQLAVDSSVAKRLIIEITETSLIEDIEAAKTLITNIKESGARVAIDDFGAGHTSFRNMRVLPIDILKIDGTFIKNLAKSEDDRFFVQTLLQLARHLGVETVAEWVQEEETANLLTSWRVEYLQGDFLGAAHNGYPIGRPELARLAG